MQKGLGQNGADGPRTGWSSGLGGGAEREARDSWEGVGEDFFSALYFVRMSCGEKDNFILFEWLEKKVFNGQK